MTLWSINRVLKLFGFRLVITIDDEGPTLLNFVSNREWKRRTQS